MSGNHRLRSAIATIRAFGRDPVTMCELYDSLNQRRYMREAHLTEEEQQAFTAEYLRHNAPDLLSGFNMEGSAS